MVLEATTGMDGTIVESFVRFGGKYRAQGE
jgi:hypothetical protein